MTTMRNEKIEKAVQWMRKLGMMSPCIEAFKNGKLWQSEGAGIFSGILYAAEPDIVAMAHKIEEEQDVVVWHAIKGHYNLGGEHVKMVSYLLVGNQDVADDISLEEYPNHQYVCFSYVQNKSWEYGSEYGDVTIMPMNGGLRRVY